MSLVRLRVGMLEYKLVKQGDDVAVLGIYCNIVLLLTSVLSEKLLVHKSRSHPPFSLPVLRIIVSSSGLSTISVQISGPFSDSLG